MLYYETQLKCFIYKFGIGNQTYLGKLQIQSQIWDIIENDFHMNNFFYLYRLDEDDSILTGTLPIVKLKKST